MQTFIRDPQFKLTQALELLGGDEAKTTTEFLSTLSSSEFSGMSIRFRLAFRSEGNYEMHTMDPIEWLSDRTLGNRLTYEELNAGRIVKRCLR